MAIYYVRSTDGNNGDDGLSWANAKATIEGALTAAAAGDTIYVSQVHAQSAAANVTITHPGSVSSLVPVRIICADDAAEPPTAVAESATVTATGTNGVAIRQGHLYLYGITFIGGVGSSFSPAFGLGNGGQSALIFERCQFRIASTGSNIRWQLGLANTFNIAVTCLDCQFRFGGTTHGLTAVHSQIAFRGGAIDGAGSLPSTLWTTNNSGRTRVLVDGMDFSAMSSGALVDITGTGEHDFVFRGCRVPSGVALTTGTIPIHLGISVIADLCGDSAGPQAMLRQSTRGIVIPETTLVRDDGASDGSAALGWKMTTIANVELYEPLASPEIARWVEVASPSSKTFTVEVLHDSATPLTDAEVWLELQYLGAAGHPRFAFATDRAATILATPANQAASSATWTTTGLSNPNAQKLDVTVTIAQRGPVLARVVVAKPSYTLYVDPLLTVS